MRVDSATRIQLEGHLEHVERHLAAWRGAAVALKQREWEHDQRWLSLLQTSPETAESVRQVAAKVAEAKVLRELTRAQQKVARLAASRLGRSADSSPLELLRELKRKRRLHVLHGQLVGLKMDLGGRLFLAAFGGVTLWLAAMVLLIAIDRNHVTPGLFERVTVALATVGVPVAWAAWTQLRSRRRLVVTEEMLLIEGGTRGVIALEHVELLRATTRPNEWHLTIASSNSPPFEPVATTMDPEELLAWVEKQGVKVEVR